MRQILSALALSLLTLPNTALPLQANSQGGQRGARFITNQLDLSWVLLDQPDSNGRWGYACLTKNRVMTGGDITYIGRYGIVAQGDAQLALEPVATAKVRSTGRGSVRPTDRYWIEDATPTPEAEIWQVARERAQQMKRTFQPGLIRGANPGELGQACVDGGIAGAVEWLEQTNRIAIEDRRGQQQDSSPQAGQSLSRVEVIPTRAQRYGPLGGMITSQDPSSPVNVRYGPGLNYEVRHIGYAGNEMTISSSQMDASGKRWYWGKLQVSGATGWVREDFLEVWADNIPPRL